jgi:sporulation protein YlmC with PRC-barrel domain
MLRSLKDLESYEIGATDGAIGHVRDFYLDDHAWVVRYLVVETGSWLTSRKVLISPMSIDRPDWAAKLLPVSISKDKVRNSPDIDTDKPVSLQNEIQYLGYYGYPNYWGGVGFWGADDYPGALDAGIGRGEPGARWQQGDRRSTNSWNDGHQRKADHHLRSCKALVGYHIHAVDGEIGHIQDMLVDEETWSIRYIVVNTSNWWLGHQVLVTPRWITQVRWADETVEIDLTRSAIKGSPVYDPSATLDREREARLYEYYGRASYWSDDPVRGNALSQR